VIEFSVVSSALARSTDLIEPPTPSRFREVSPAETLIRTHFAFVWRVARRFGLGVEDAEDAAQRVMLIAADRVSELTPGKERAFLFRVAMRVASNISRSRRRRREDIRENIEADALEFELDEEPDPEQLLEQRRYRERLDRILSTMPEDLKTAFISFEIEGLSLLEIASALGIPQGTVSSRLRRAREHFMRAAVRMKGALP
jgi:RNA polymerase sigma-70 factor (ECF subfamily)